MVWEVRKRGGFDLGQDAGGDREQCTWEKEEDLMGWNSLLAFIFVVSSFVAPVRHTSAQPFLLHPSLDRLHYFCPLSPTQTSEPLG